MEHDEELISNHETQLEVLSRVTTQQTQELEKGRKVFENFDTWITTIETSVKKLEDEFVAKKEENGHTKEEVTSLRDMITKTAQDVSYLRGLKDGQQEHKQDNKDWKAFAVQIVFVIFAVVNVVLWLLKDWLHWIT